MQYFLEVIVSAVVGGLILLMLLQLNEGIVNSATTSSVTSSVQGNLTSMSEEVEYYFRKIGYNVQTGPSVLLADSNRITFLCDIDLNGSVDSIKYFLSDTSSLSATPNPRDKLLYRQINTDAAVASNLGITDFDLLYYNSSGTLTNILNEIRYVKYSLMIESSYPFNGAYPNVYIERIIQPNNLR